MTTWAADVVDHMLDLKQAGWAHEEAWRSAMRAHPPRGRDLGPERPSLLDEDESVAAFFKRATYDAWHGLRPALAHFHASLLQDVDLSEPAARTERQRKLAA